MKLSNLKTLLPGMILGLSLLAAVPVSAGNLHSENTPPEQFERLNSTDDEAVEADSQNSDDTGNVYNFKDSKTSGIVTVTKTWEDSLSNDERPIPDVSISTVEPSKLNRTYTITFHGNGMKFADGSEKNTVIYNGSGHIIAGTYKEPPSGFATWCFDATFQNKAVLNPNGTLPPSFLNSIDRTSIDLYAKEKTFVLKTGSDFNKFIPSTATSVIFTDEAMPASAELIDVDEDGDKGIVAWMNKNIMMVSSQISGQKIIANKDCSAMFYYKSNLLSIDLSNLSTSDVTNVSRMFFYCSGLTSLDLSPLDTRNVVYMNRMFYRCSGLTNLDLTPLVTSNVRDMSGMFSECSGFTRLDLSTLSTSNVAYITGMFSGCSSIVSLDLSMLDLKNVSEVSDWYKNSVGGHSATYGAIFENCSSLVNLKLPMLSSKITNTDRMFYYCTNLVSIDLTTVNTSNVTDMYSMFSGCKKLTSLDLSSFNTYNVVDMDSMFYDCTKLASLDLTSWDTSKVTTMKYMFSLCNNLTILSLGNKFAFVGEDYYLTGGFWYSADGTFYTSNGTTCTIPSNKADTYTKK